ncbi:MAG: FkbM family methyltransferase [Coriobacteriia bacterium]|nr:FkbM family methyltransferase [Coriobacteriia bacterium]
MTHPLTTATQSDLVFDVGLHMGEDTDYYLKKGFRVIAFEANSDLVESCRARFKSAVADGRLVIVEGAIVDADAIAAGQQTVPFYVNDSTSVWGTACQSWAERNERLGATSRRVDVPVVDFRAALIAHGMPHYMRIDIEGCDQVCIDALRQFSTRPDYLSIESDKTSFAAIRREIDTLVSLGYDSFQAVEQSELPLRQSPPVPAREGASVTHRFEEGASGLFGAELDAEWKTRDKILAQYRAIRAGYYLLGDDGIMTNWHFRGAGRAQRLVRSILRPMTGAVVPGWYDTHARHAMASDIAS